MATVGDQHRADTHPFLNWPLRAYDPAGGHHSQPPPFWSTAGTAAVLEQAWD